MRNGANTGQIAVFSPTLAVKHEEESGRILERSNGTTTGGGKGHRTIG